MSNLEIVELYKIKISKIIGCDKNDVIFKCKGIIITKNHDINYSKGDFKGGNYHVYFKNEYLSQFSLAQFPACCAYVISHTCYVAGKFKSLGIGSLLNEFRQEISRNMGFTSIICTDIETNSHQRKILSKNGFKDIYNAVNKRTKNNVFISIKEL